MLAAIAVDPELTMAQKQSLTQIYETFRRENARLAETTAAANGAAEPATPAASEPAQAPQAPATVTPAATGPTTPDGTPTEAVLESVAVTEAGPAPAPTTTARPKKSTPKAAGAAEEEKS